MFNPYSNSLLRITSGRMRGKERLLLANVAAAAKRRRSAALHFLAQPSCHRRTAAAGASEAPLARHDT